MSNEFKNDISIYDNYNKNKNKLIKDHNEKVSNEYNIINNILKSVLDLINLDIKNVNNYFYCIEYNHNQIKYNFKYINDTNLQKSIIDHFNAIINNNKVANEQDKELIIIQITNLINKNNNLINRINCLFKLQLILFELFKIKINYSDKYDGLYHLCRGIIYNSHDIFNESDDKLKEKFLNNVNNLNVIDNKEIYENLLKLEMLQDKDLSIILKDFFYDKKNQKVKQYICNKNNLENSILYYIIIGYYSKIMF
jgi:hypothetical protein